MSDESTPEGSQPSEMEMLPAEMRAGFQAVGKRFDHVDERFDGIDRRFDEVNTRFDGIDKRLDGVDTRLGGHDKRFEVVDKRHVTTDARITDEAAVTRSHFDVIAEGLRESFNLVIDKTMATGEKVDQLIASNAIEHGAILAGLTDHEVRITRLEAAGVTPKPTTT